MSVFDGMMCLIFPILTTKIFSISMTITENYLKEYFKDKRNLFLLWNKEDRPNHHEDYFLMDYLAVFIPMTGSIDLETNMSVIHSVPGSIQFFTHDTYVKVMDASEDYSSIGIVFSKKYWNHTLVHSHPSLTLSAVHPCLEISEEQHNILMEFFRIIKGLKDAGREDDHPVVLNLILGIFYHVGRFYEKWSLAFPKQSGDKVISNFVSLLYLHYREHRDVAFYADKAHLSKSRFTEIIRNSTGMTPYQCIERYTILKTCLLLRNTDMSIKEIAFNLNFSDASHFCKFFRKHMRQSPQEFRNEVVIHKDQSPLCHPELE